MNKTAQIAMLTVLLGVVLTAAPAFCRPGPPDGPDRMAPGRDGPDQPGKMQPPAPNPPPPDPQPANGVTIQVRVTPIRGTTTIIEIRTLDTHDGPRPGLDRPDRPAPPAPADRGPEPEPRRDGDQGRHRPGK